MKKRTIDFFDEWYNKQIELYDCPEEWSIYDIAQKAYYKALKDYDKIQKAKCKHDETVIGVENVYCKRCGYNLTDGE